MKSPAWLATGVVLGCLLDSSTAAVPPTRQNPVSETLFGQEVVDQYRWLEALEKDSSEVLEWTDTQHAHTRSVLDALECRESFATALRPLFEIPSIGLPRARRAMLFYTERTGTQNQAVLMSRPFHSGTANVLIDPTSLSDRGLVSLDWWAPTEDGLQVAYGTSESGSEMSVLRVRTVGGADLGDRIDGKVSFGGWFRDEQRFVYGVLADPKDPYSRQWRVHTLGTDPTKDPTLLAQSDPTRVPFLSISHDGRWLVGGVSRGWQANDLFIARAADWARTGEFKPADIATSLDGRFEPIGVLNGRLYLVCTHESPRGRIAVVNLKNWPNLGPNSILTLIPEHPTMTIEDAKLSLERLIVTWQRDATNDIEVFDLDGSSRGHVPLPGLGSVSISAEEDRNTGFISFTSYNYPPTISAVNWSAATEPPVEWARPKVPMDPSAVSVEQNFATSKDGTRVPYFLVHRNGLKPGGGGHPCLMNGYGGFNISMTPHFMATNWPWYDLGGVFVVANLRGGSEYGESWHQAGMLANKQNVFDDLFAVAEDLIKRGWTTAEQLAVTGGSNGGLLVGAAITQRPDLFAAAVCKVPLLDMLRYDQFLMAKFWVPEYGAPADAAAFGWLLGYSPYHRVKAGTPYPATLLRAGENDSRVHPMHARKMTARLQANTSGDATTDPIMLLVERDAGHGAGKPLTMRLAEAVDDWSFIAWQTGACRKPNSPSATGASSTVPGG